MLHFDDGLSGVGNAITGNCLPVTHDVEIKVHSGHCPGKEYQAIRAVLQCEHETVISPEVVVLSRLPMLIHASDRDKCHDNFQALQPHFISNSRLERRCSKKGQG